MIIWHILKSVLSMIDWLFEEGVDSQIYIWYLKGSAGDVFSLQVMNVASKLKALWA